MPLDRVWVCRMNMTRRISMGPGTTQEQNINYGTTFGIPNVRFTEPERVA